MAYKRLKLKHHYHDALVTAIRYESQDVILEVWIWQTGPAAISFLGVRNFDEVRDALEVARQKNAGRTHIDEIIGIARDADRAIVLDLATAGGVRVDAKGIVET